MGNAIINKLTSMTAGEIFEIAFELKDKMDDASDMVFTAALEALEGKVDESKYVDLMERLA